MKKIKFKEAFKDQLGKQKDKNNPLLFALTFYDIIDKKNYSLRLEGYKENVMLLEKDKYDFYENKNVNGSIDSIPYIALKNSKESKFLSLF